MRSMEHTELLDADEVAARLGVTRGMIYVLIHREELPVVRIGRRVRIPADGLAAFLARGGTRVRS